MDEPITATITIRGVPLLACPECGALSLAPELHEEVLVATSMARKAFIGRAGREQVVTWSPARLVRLRWLARAGRLAVEGHPKTH